MVRRLITLILMLGQLTSTAYSGCIQMHVIVGCTVGAANKFSFNVNDLPASRYKYCSPISTIKNRVGAFNVSCPKGSKICIRQSVSEYIETADGTLIKVKAVDPEKNTIYSDAACTQVWDSNKVKYHTFTNHNESYHEPLFCKRNIKDNKSEKNQRVIVLDLTIEY